MFQHIIIILCIFNFTTLNSYALRGSYNLILNNKEQEQIDQVRIDGVLRVLDNGELIKRDIEDEEKKFHELNRLASREYDKSSKSPNRNWVKRNYSVFAVTESDNHIGIPTITHELCKRDITNPKEKVLEDWDYDHFAYIDQYDIANYGAEDYKKSHQEQHRKKLDASDTKLSLVADYKSKRQSSTALATRFRKIAKSWLLVYLIIAVPMWCTTGWCCCCLYCKIFKPQQVIEDSKKYLMMNPPGFYKPNHGKEMYYKPTDCEKECYEEFEHLLKTI